MPEKADVDNKKALSEYKMYIKLGLLLVFFVFFGIKC